MSDRLGQPDEAQWICMPVSEFEGLMGELRAWRTAAVEQDRDRYDNLEEQIRLRGERIEGLLERLRLSDEKIGVLQARARRWQAVVAQVHPEDRADGHRNPYDQCPHITCVAARLGT